MIDKMKIDFVWIDWELKDFERIRDIIKISTEQEKVEIVKNLALVNAFLLRRNADSCFKNLIYSKILENPSIRANVMREIYKILTKKIMDEEEIKKALKEDFLRAGMVMPGDSLIESIMKISKTQGDAITYLEQKVVKYKEKGDYEKFIITDSHLKAHRTGLFNIDGYFATMNIPSAPTFQLKYEELSRSYIISSLHNYNIYQSSLGGLRKIGNLFAKTIYRQFENILYDHLGIDKNSEVVIRYEVLFNHLLSIASKIYFSGLGIEQKLDLLNNYGGMSEFIRIIDSEYLNLSFNDLNIAAGTLLDEGYYSSALELLIKCREKFFDTLEPLAKLSLLDKFADLYHEISNNTELLIILNQGQELLDSLSEPISSNPIIVNAKLRNLINLGECHGSLKEEENQEKYFSKVLEFIEQKVDPHQKVLLLVKLSRAYRNLKDYEFERSYLSKAIDFTEKAHEQEVYIDRRLDDFLNTKMNPEMLEQISGFDRISMRLKDGKRAQASFNFGESLEIFKDILNIYELKSLKDKRIRAEVSKLIGLSHLFLGHHEDSAKYLSNSLSYYNGIETQCRLLILNIMNKNRSEGLKLLKSIINAFEANPQAFRNNFNTLIEQALNYTGEQGIEYLIELVRDVDAARKNDFLYFAGIKVGDLGFSELAIRIFEKEIDNLEDGTLKAKYFNSIGTVYFHLDELDLAIEAYNKCIKMDKTRYKAYGNISECYVRKLDFAKACEYSKKKLNSAKRQNINPLELLKYKLELKVHSQMIENVLNLKAIPSDKVRNILLDAERLYFVILTSNNELSDASPIMINYARALEIMLHENVSSKFDVLIIKYKKMTFTFDFKKKFLPLFHNRSISLGSWVRIIDDFKHPISDKSIADFKSCLDSNFTQKELDIFKKAAEFLGQERNRVAHLGTIPTDDIRELRNKSLPLLNQVINLIY